MKEFDCQLNKMFDVGINKTYVLHLIINCKGYVAAQYRQKFFLTKVKLEDDEVSDNRFSLGQILLYTIQSTNI